MPIITCRNCTANLFEGETNCLRCGVALPAPLSFKPPYNTAQPINSQRYQPQPVSNHTVQLPIAQLPAKQSSLKEEQRPAPTVRATRQNTVVPLSPLNTPLSGCRRYLVFYLAILLGVSLPILLVVAISKSNPTRSPVGTLGSKTPNLFVSTQSVTITVQFPTLISSADTPIAVAPASSDNRAFLLSSPLNKMVFSPQGRFLAILTQDNMLEVYSLATRARITITTNHVGNINTLLLKDNNYLLTAGADGTVRIFNALSGNLLNNLEHKTSVSLVSCSEACSAIAVYESVERKILLWNQNSNGSWQIYKKQNGEPNAIQTDLSPITLAISSDGKLLAGGGSKTADNLRLWNTTYSNTGASQNSKKSLNKLKEAYDLLLFSPDNKYLAGWSSEIGSLKVWDIQADKELDKFDIGKGKQLNVITFSPDSKYLYLGGEGQVQKWELGKKPEPPKNFSTLGSIKALAITGDGKLVIAGFNSSTSTVNLLIEAI